MDQPVKINFKRIQGFAIAVIDSIERQSELALYVIVIDSYSCIIKAVDHNLANDSFVPLKKPLLLQQSVRVRR